MKWILIIEDNEALLAGLRFDLEEEKYMVTATGSAQEAYQLVNQKEFDLILLDVNLPDENGFVLCQRIKQLKDIPIIFLTACDLEKDEIKGFELGADDYITKPFSMPLLRKRISAVLKRYSGNKGRHIYNDGFLMFNFDTMSALKENTPLILTPTEYKLLKLFINNSGNVLTRQIILERLWDKDNNFVDEHTLTVNINRLRSKIEDHNHKYIRTIYGMGYQWIGEREQAYV
ncbi:response regulator transcription factor [Anaerocolumna sp. AGMB13025]|uniref:response regulator transcription factor n=1 Tax=Anaerocolumna sp. AGMB13025 TaxID=3039116 RepID=UPI00241DE514|nr:response regulator transcription factor [Anaerocolumna sp. AGMB13025]WFR56980.1 response regulator transcription factor [Anaerocolumna sp. AGMB13025]